MYQLLAESLKACVLLSKLRGRDDRPVLMQDAVTGRAHERKILEARPTLADLVERNNVMDVDDALDAEDLSRLEVADLAC